MVTIDAASHGVWWRSETLWWVTGLTICGLVVGVSPLPGAHLAGLLLLIIAAGGVLWRLLASTSRWAEQCGPLFWALVAQLTAPLVFIGWSAARHVGGTAGALIALGVVVGGAAWWIRRQHARTSSSSASASFASLPHTTALVMLAVFAVVVASTRELPRLAMLSGDPDTHLMHAMSVFRQGAVPWPGDGESVLGYPSFFAVLNLEWWRLSGADPRDVVTMQPALQSMVTVAAVFDLARRRAHHDGSARPQWHWWLLLAAVWLLLAPWGNTPGHEFLEGTGRMSALPPMFLWWACLTGRARTAEPTPALRRIVMAIVLGGAVLLNPVHGPLFGAIAIGSTLGRWLIRRGHDHSPSLRSELVDLVLVATMAALLVCMDPYVANMLHGTTTTVALQVEGTPIPRGGEYWRRVGESVGDIVSSLPLPDVLAPRAGAILTAAITVWLAFKKYRVELACVVGALMMCMVLQSLLMPFVGTASSLRLLPSYFAGQEKMWCTLVLLWASAMMMMQSHDSSTGPIAVGALAGLMVLNGLPKIRAEWPSAQGPVSIRDEVLAQRLATRIASEGDSPLVLMVNMPVRINQEQWLLPLGGQRALLAHPEIRMAFSYYQNGSIFSNDSYMKNVCDDFNLQWLKSQGVRYIFLGEYADDGCVALDHRQLAAFPIIDQEGDARVVALPASLPAATPGAPRVINVRSTATAEKGTP